MKHMHKSILICLIVLLYAHKAYTVHYLTHTIYESAQILFS